MKQLLRGLACVVCGVLASCTIRSEHETILPWLLKKSTYRAFGSFGGSTENTYYTHYWGFWRGLDIWDASVLDAEHVLVRDEEGAGILRKGSLSPVRVCGVYERLSVPPIDGAVDCLSAAAHSDGGVTEIRLVRRGLAGEILEDWSLSAIVHERVFHPSLGVLFYDESGAPYFSILDPAAARDYRALPSRCALLTTAGSGTPRVVPAPTQMALHECFQRGPWEALLERPLYAATQRREPLEHE